MTDRYVLWQNHWRAKLGLPLDSLPQFNGDFDIHFDIWGLPDDEIKECFSLFPNGEAIARRAIAARSVNFDQVRRTEDSEFISILKEMNKRVSMILCNERMEDETASVFRGDEELRARLFRMADPPTIELNDALSEIIESKCGSEGIEAFFFLREPLYRLANSYEVANWVSWALVENDISVDPYEPGFELYKRNAQAGWSNDGLFVFVEESSS